MQYNQFENLNNSAIKTLQQKIMEANFNEPKAVLTTLAGRANALNESSSKKKRLLGMGLPFDYSDQKIKFNLEVVQEKPSTNKLELSSDKKTSFKSNQFQEGVVKKIKGGAVVQDGSMDLRQPKQKPSFASVG
jgi:DNA-nicking Smr family endonuclease